LHSTVLALLSVLDRLDRQDGIAFVDPLPSHHASNGQLASEAGIRHYSPTTKATTVLVSRPASSTHGLRDSAVDTYAISPYRPTLPANTTCYMYSIHHPYLFGLVQFRYSHILENPASAPAAVHPLASGCSSHRPMPQFVLRVRSSSRTSTHGFCWAIHVMPQTLVRLSTQRRP
jgi:hypothetical protein